MNFLTEIKHFIKTEVMGIEETKPTETKSTNKKPPVIECKTEAPEDKVEIKNTAAQESKQASGMSLAALKKTISNLPANVNIEKLIKNGLLNQITGLTDEELEKLSTQEKNIIIEAVNFAIKHSNKTLGSAFPNAIFTEVSIADHAKNAYEAIRQGFVKNAQEFENEVGNVAEELGSDYTEIPGNEQISTLKKARIKQDKKAQAEIEAANRLPENERKARLRRINGRKKYAGRSRFNDATALARRVGKMATGVVSAMNNAVILLDSEDMPHGAKFILNTCSSNEERTQIADAANFEHQKKIIKAYKEIGDEPSAESIKGYTATYMEAKSSEAVFEYQADYKSDRDMYEAALEKQRNGEALTAEEQELLSVMKNEYYTATAQGIGEGALNNVNMSTTEKAEFINKWETDAKCYDDYKEVTQDVKKSVDEKPEYKEIKEQIQEQNKKKENAAVTSSESDNSPAYTGRLNQTQHNIRPTVTQPAKRSSINLATIPQELKQPESEDREVKSVNEAIQEYGHKAVVAILEDNSLAHLKPQLKGVIKSYDLNTLQEIALKCSDSSFVYICKLIGNENKDKLIDFREKTKGLCYSAKEQIENLRGENAIA